MGVFSGLLSGLLGGSGLGDIASKAMDIGGKLFNRKEGQSFGDALIGQLPAIASGLGGVAKNFGGMIPGIGGIVSKIGGMVEEGAKEFGGADESGGKKLALEDIPKGMFKDLLEWYDRKLNDKTININEELNRLVPNVGEGNPMGDIMYKAWEMNKDPNYNNRSSYLPGQWDEDHYYEELVKKWLAKPSNIGINSPESLLRHASNNMPIMAGFNGLRGEVMPAVITRQDIDYPADSRGNSSSNWRKFPVNRAVMIDPLQENSLHDINLNNMYASSLPSVMHKSTAVGQSLDDLKPVVFRKSFIR